MTPDPCKSKRRYHHFREPLRLHAVNLSARKNLFETSTAVDKARMSRAAPTFFGDINRMFIEYMILQVCKITDPAHDFEKTTIIRLRFFCGTTI